MEFLLFLIWVAVFGGLCAYIAGEKGRSSFNWAILGAMFGVFALIAIAVIPVLPRHENSNSADYITSKQRSDNADAFGGLHKPRSGPSMIEKLAANKKGNL